jgi:hypothetical protein
MAELATAAKGMRKNGIVSAISSHQFHSGLTTHQAKIGTTPKNPSG